MKIGATLLALIATAQTAAYLLTAPAAPADGMGTIFKAYRSVERFLPSHGQVGFVLTSQDPNFNSINYYLAQQALAPTILSTEITNDTDFVITPTGTPADVNNIPALQSFVLVATADSDIRVLRKRAP